MSKDEALKLALDALEVATTPFARDRQEVLRAQAALREALAEQPIGCQCPACLKTLHASDCAVHNAPAYPVGECDCGAQPYPENFIDALKYDVARRDSEQAELTDWQERAMVAEAALAKLLDEKTEPVAVVSGYYGGQCVILPIDPARIYNSNTPLYTAPQPCPTCEALARTVMLDQTSHDTHCKPLSCETLRELWCDASLSNSGSGWFVVSEAFARAIEAAHNIKERP